MNITRCYYRIIQENTIRLRIACQACFQYTAQAFLPAGRIRGICTYHLTTRERSGPAGTTGLTQWHENRY